MSDSHNFEKFGQYILVHNNILGRTNYVIQPVWPTKNRKFIIFDSLCNQNPRYVTDNSHRCLRDKNRKFIIFDSLEIKIPGTLQTIVIDVCETKKRKLTLFNLNPKITKKTVIWTHQKVSERQKIENS